MIQLRAGGVTVEEQPLVPGPPRGQRRERGAVGDVLRRIEAARAAESEGSPASAAVGLLRVAGDAILLLKDTASDPRVPRRTKVLVALAAVYLVSPLDLVPDVIGVVGQLDDLAVAVLAVRRLLRDAGYDVIYDLWRGSDEGLALVLTLAGVQT